MIHNTTETEAHEYMGLYIGTTVKTQLTSDGFPAQAFHSLFASLLSPGGHLLRSLPWLTYPAYPAIDIHLHLYLSVVLCGVTITSTVMITLRNSTNWYYKHEKHWYDWWEMLNICRFVLTRKTYLRIVQNCYWSKLVIIVQVINWRHTWIIE